MSAKPYDQSYFDKWYRDPRHRVSTPAATRRKVHLALAVAEYYLEHPVRTVLDVGCGEGHWQPHLNRLRPNLRYTGVDSSAYAVARFGRRRHLILGNFSSLDQLGLMDAYDLIVCSDTLYYLDAATLRRGFGALVARLDGVAFLEAYASEVALLGDLDGLEPRTNAFYRQLFQSHGLVSCGSHCYVGPDRAGSVTALEQGALRTRDPAKL